MYTFKFTRALDKARKNPKVTLEQLAGKCGYSVSSMGKWSTGVHTPSLEAVERIAGVFGMKLSDFIKLGEE